MTGSRSEALQERTRVLRLIEAKLMHNQPSRWRMLLTSCLTSVSLHYADYLISIMQHLPDRLDVSQFDYVLTPICLLATLATRG
jgi:hypothetical protein